jgi:hypothetical protein
MDAGRELDALVAEKVMKLKNRFRKDSLRTEKCLTVRQVEQNKKPWNINGKWKEFPPQYSTDISAAWEVVEELKGDYWFSFYYTVEGKWETMFNAHFPRQNPSFDAESDLASHSVCLAALKAVGHKF